MNRAPYVRLRGASVATIALTAVLLPGCDADRPPVDGGPPLPVQQSSGGTSNQAQTSGGASGAGGSLNHTDCFQGCSLCVGDVYYSAPSHPAYVGDCCTIATQQVCEFGCQVYVGCLPAADGMGGLGGAGGADAGGGAGGSSP